MTAHNNSSAASEGDISERLRKEAFEAVDWNGETMKQWDKIRALCAERDGSDLPRLMFESLIDSLSELMIDGANEIDRLRQVMRAPAQAVQVRNETIEECAKVADVNYGLMYTALRNKEVARAVADQIARGIRNLAAAKPPAAPVETDVIAVDAKLLHSLWCYGQLHTVEGVVYSYGTHQKCLDAVDDLIADHAAACEANPHNGSSADMVDALAKTIWLAEFERAFSRAPTDPWENQAESAKASHLNTARKIIEAGFVNAALPQPTRQWLGHDTLQACTCKRNAQIAHEPPCPLSRPHGGGK